MTTHDGEHDDAVDVERIERDREMYARHKAVCERHPVAPGEVRTTPPPAVDVEALSPDLKGRGRTAVRLHPRFGQEPPADASKLGGHFLWPADEPWPTCATHRIPYATVLQIRAEEYPEIAFRPGTDLMQLLWCPRDHDTWVEPALFWRRRADITRPHPEASVSERAFLEYVPLPCRLLPERVVEYPGLYEVHPIGIYDDPAHTALGRALTEWGWRTGLREDPCSFYESQLSVSSGVKLGGYTSVVERGEWPVCRCGRAMEYLLTIDSAEWDAGGAPRWCPLEDQKYDEVSDREKFEAAHRATGLGLGDRGLITFFLCRSCPDWPVRHVTFTG